jgi:hypothetical protein
MLKIKEVLRLKYDCGISEREIVRSCHTPTKPFFIFVSL